MGGTRVVWEEPGKQKPRSALFASRPRDCGRGNSPEAAPKQKRGGRGKMDFISLVGGGDPVRTPMESVAEAVGISCEGHAGCTADG